jgi:hypothetical protein
MERGEAMGISLRTLAVWSLRIACAVSVWLTTPAWAAGPLDDFAVRSSVGSMFYFRLPLGSHADTMRGGTLNFVLRNEFVSSYVFQRELNSYPGRATTSLNLIDLKFGLSTEFHSLAIGGVTALGDASSNK